MARKPTGNPSGRPQNPIDWKLFEQLCGLLCTQSEIASMLGVHVDTLRDRVLQEYGDDYSTTYKKHSEVGKCSLRRNQFVLSKKNATLAIWLGKQWLGQTDKAPGDGSEMNLSTILKMFLEGKIKQDKVHEDTTAKMAIE